MKKEEKEREEEKIEETAESVQSDADSSSALNDEYCEDSGCSCSGDIELLKAELCKKDQEIASLKTFFLETRPILTISENALRRRKNRIRKCLL